MNSVENYFLQPGYIFVSREEYNINTVLGSCVSICLWDSVNEFGGMNHYIYSRSKKGKNNARYGDVSIPYLIKLMVEMGSKNKDLVAHIVGGGYNPILTPVVGEENVEIAKKILNEKKIKISTQDVGGETGRKVVFNNKSGEIMVYKGINVRRGDWYSK